MKKLKLILIFLFCFSIRSFAHGEQAIIAMAPIIVYFMILPVFISNWEYRNIIKRIHNTDFSKKGLWIQNYLVGFCFILFLLIVSVEEISTTGGIAIVVAFIVLETLVKSFFYFIFNASKKVKYIQLLESTYKLNVAIIVVVIGLSIIIGYLFL
ncbi:MAG: hypothetical protein WC780_19250 [Lentimicrobiaceae bacterium]|jgi:hypothetical protein